MAKKKTIDELSAEELFDLADDPDELHNLASAIKELAAQPK